MKDSMRSELNAAKVRATAHRLLLRQNIVATRLRLAPRELKRDVTDKLGEVARGTRDGATRSVKNHPVAAGLGAVAIAAYLLRKPIATISPKVGHWLTDRFIDIRARIGGKDTRPKYWTEY